MNLRYTFHSGKNWNIFFHIKSNAMHLIPRFVYNLVFPLKFKYLMRNQDVEYLRDRVNYYCKLNETTPLPQTIDKLSSIKRKHQTDYYHDLYRTQRWFSKDLQCNLLAGDVTYIPDVPSIIKSRPVEGDNRNSIVLKLDRTRHFIFLKDKNPYDSKLDKVIFRGGCTQPHRIAFMKKFFGHPLVDAHEVTKHASKNPPEWKEPPMTLYDHMKYKFIMSIEGNDVASNLKWVMSSNSIAVMPRPTYETWFMEGRLIPNYHYIEIKSDYSDLEERIQYYINHPDEAKAIVEHAHEYVSQFKNKRREILLEILVFEKYLEMTGQINNHHLGV